MEYKVIKRFRDKNTKEVHVPKGIYETDDKDRASELISRGFLQKEEEESSVLDQNVSGVKESITKDLSREELESLLAQEKEGQSRKGVIEHIESILEDNEDESSAVQE